MKKILAWAWLALIVGIFIYLNPQIAAGVIVLFGFFSITIWAVFTLLDIK